MLLFIYSNANRLFLGSCGPWLIFGMLKHLMPGWTIRWNVFHGKEELDRGLTLKFISVVTGRDMDVFVGEFYRLFVVLMVLSRLKNRRVCLHMTIRQWPISAIHGNRYSQRLFFNDVLRNECQVFQGEWFSIGIFCFMLFLDFLKAYWSSASIFRILVQFNYFI